MEKELKLLLPLLENTSEITINDYLFTTGTLFGKEVVVMKCGIGKVNAAVATLTLIENFHVKLIVNTGVAGGTGSAARILDVVVGEKVAYHDVWCGPGTFPGEASGCPLYFESPFARKLIAEEDGIKFGLIASGDIFISKPEEIKRIKEIYPDVMAVDMESAAIAQVCYIKNVPFLSVRVISDTPGEEDNIAQYENFWEDAPQSTFNTLKHIMSAL